MEVGIVKEVTSCACSQLSRVKIYSFAGNRLAFEVNFSIVFSMELPGQPVTLSVEQIAELNKQLGNLRHDINNCLALVIAGLEVIQHKPHLGERMMATVSEQPPKIVDAITKFSGELEKALGIRR